MSLIANLMLYLLTKYNMSNIAVVNVLQIWSGSSNIASIGGALISDTFLGRFWTLFYGSIASLLVNNCRIPIFFPLSSNNNNNRHLIYT